MHQASSKPLDANRRTKMGLFGQLTDDVRASGCKEQHVLFTAMLSLPFAAPERAALTPSAWLQVVLEAASVMLAHFGKVDVSFHATGACHCLEESRLPILGMFGRFQPVFLRPHGQARVRRRLQGASHGQAENGSPVCFRWDKNNAAHVTSHNSLA
jgi:hypothetical protein